jgi:hypothetical protein
VTPDVTPGAAVRVEGNAARPAAVPAAIAGRLGRALALRSTAPVDERAIVIEHREPLI